MDFLAFDANGFLAPQQTITCDLKAVETAFVDGFSTSATRRRLFNHFLRYLNDFQSRVSQGFVLWLDGSFLTLKDNPNDMDFVIFLDYRIYEMQEPFLDKYWTFSLEEQGLDAYLVRSYPANHTEYSNFVTNQNNWLVRYTHTKPNSEAKIFRKGLVELIFERR